MNPQMQKYEHVFPEKVYHCPCFRFGVEECFNHGQRSFASIIRYLENFDYKNNFLCKRFFSTAVGENMEHCLIVCGTHLKTLLVGAKKIRCTSPENNQTVSLNYTDKKEVFCIKCVRHYMKFMYFIFNFVQF